MRIAVTYENGDIYQHFGHTERFKIYDVQDGKVVESRIIDTNGRGTRRACRYSPLFACGYPDLRRYRRRCTDGTCRMWYQAVWRCFRQR